MQDVELAAEGQSESPALAVPWGGGWQQDPPGFPWPLLCLQQALRGPRLVLSQHPTALELINLNSVLLL